MINNFEESLQDKSGKDLDLYIEITDTATILREINSFKEKLAKVKVDVQVNKASSDMKYGLGELVWYMYENKVCSSKILSRILVDHYEEPIAYALHNIGKERREYLLCVGFYTEDLLFASKEELLASL